MELTPTVGRNEHLTEDVHRKWGTCRYWSGRELDFEERNYWNFLTKTGWRFSRQFISKFPQSQVSLGHLCLRAAILEWCLSWWECTQGCPVRGRQKSETLVLSYTSLLQDFFYKVFYRWFSLRNCLLVCRRLLISQMLPCASSFS